MVNNIEPMAGKISKSTDALGRLLYFGYLFFINLISFGLLIAFGSNGGPIFIIVLLFNLFFVFHLTHKRCIDILGKKEKSVIMTLGLLFACLIPYVGFISLLYLLFAKGKISSKVIQATE
jgi:hypothetical protein